MSLNPAAGSAARNPLLERLVRPYAQLALSILLSGLSQVFLKLGAVEEVPGHGLAFGGLASGWVWLGIVAQIASLFSWLFALRSIPLSIAFTFAGAIHVIV